MINDEHSCSVTVFILANNESALLRETISQIRSLKYFNCIKKIFIVAKNEESPCITEAENIITESNDDVIEIHVQRAPNIELCVCEFPAMVKTTHLVIMHADLGTNPANLDDFIEKAIQYPERIICATKWHKESVFDEYGKLRKLATVGLNSILCFILNKRAYDIIGLFQIYPMSIYKKLNFSLDRSFGYEYTMKALHNGVEYEEIPTTYIPRSEGKTNFHLPTLLYIGFWIMIFAIKVRLSPKEEAFKDNKKTRSK